MPPFTYKARNAQGAVLEGIIEAQEQRVVIDQLRSQKLVILEVKEKTISPLDIIKGLVKSKGQVTSKDLVLFSRQLSTLVSAGVPIVQGLAILESQAENPAFKEVLGAVRGDIEGGLSISDALRKHPAAFPEFYTSMVRAGELGGILDTILERLTAYLESSEALKAKVKSAMMYPGIVLSICAIVTVFLLVFVIPTFKTIFEGFGAELPLPTQMLIDLSDLMKQYFILILISPVAGWKGFKKFYGTAKGKKWVDAKVLKAPIFGIILKKVAVAKFTRTLGTLIKSGVPIMQALETVAATAGNVVVSEAILSTRESIREGGHLSDPLKKSGLFPNMVTSMISVGEETGALDTMLNKIADFYDMEVDAAVKGLTSLIEPIVIVIMGFVIGTIVIAMFMPMFGMGELAGNMDK
ncbi:MAG: pilus assembly protein PilC [Elusimicrobia bacterium RIFCSPHIGHO2_02_FULL_57_9]|nr:MAG: pilus assembly protein PilC [Elusimicrobia bacterium RIFCSPHIGHO2_02_FULL_57_9]